MTKQTSIFCGMNRQLSRYDPLVENVCPSYGKNNESSKHIIMCRDGGQTKLWKQSVQEITNWIAQTTLNLLLCDMLEKYLLAWGEKTMQECLWVRSMKHQMLADTHDKLG